MIRLISINHKSLLVTAALLTIPIYLFKYLKQLKQEYEQKLLFKKRHNCVVVYYPMKGFSGWPLEGPNVGRIENYDNIEEQYHPLLYFISTAQKTIDVCTMFINVNCIIFELIKAKRRGIRIRVLSNFPHNGSDRQDQIRALMDEGIECQCFVSVSTTLDSIMHHKFMVKDYCDESGYACTGSMNFSVTSVLNNYESFVFMSNYHVIEAFQTNFEECWKNVCLDNKGLINKTILIDSQLDTCVK